MSSCDERANWIFGEPGKGTLDDNFRWYWENNKQYSI